MVRVACANDPLAYARSYRVKVRSGCVCVWTLRTCNGGRTTTIDCKSQDTSDECSMFTVHIVKCTVLHNSQYTIRNDAKHPKANYYYYSTTHQSMTQMHRVIRN